MKRGLFGKKKRRHSSSGEMELQITAMADIFTVLLVFLLKSYATSAATITPSKDVMLPSGAGSDNPVEALKVEISQAGVLIEGQPAAPLTEFAFDSQDLQANGASKALVSALERERKRQLLIAQNNPDVKVDAKIIVISDQRAPYSTVKSVLASAALNGYTDFKLAVVQEN